jgi:hypothetical protein
LEKQIKTTEEVIKRYKHVLESSHNAFKEMDYRNVIEETGKK